MGRKQTLDETGKLGFAEFAAHVRMAAIDDLHGALARGV